MVNVEKYTKFPNLNSILMWAKADKGGVLEDIVYVKKDEQFYYFGFNGRGYSLLMTSSRDLADAQ